MGPAPPSPAPCPCHPDRAEKAGSVLPEWHCAQVGGDQFWKLLSAVVAAQQLFIIYLSDQKSIQIIKYRIQQGSTKKLPAKANMV